MLKISPSIASSNQINLKQVIRDLEASSIENIHIDIEDGSFIPNITFGLKTIRNLKEITDIPFSIHIMSYYPENYIYNLAEIGVDSITVNIEACPYPMKIINMIRDLKIKAGIALNPKTQIGQILYLMDELDIILIMTCEPDNRGQRFIEKMIDKVNVISSINKGKSEIWVDGGISKPSIEPLYRAGAEYIVLGREIFNDRQIKENIHSLNESIYTLK